MKVSPFYRWRYEAWKACLEIAWQWSYWELNQTWDSAFFILYVVEPSHDIFPDPFRKPNYSFLLQDRIYFPSDVVVVLKLIRNNHRFKLLHHLIPESVTSRMLAFKSHVFLLWLSESSPQGLLSERLNDSCGASWNQMCNNAKLCVNAVFRTSLQNLIEGIPAYSSCVTGKGQVAVCHHSFVTWLVLKEGGLH